MQGTSHEVFSNSYQFQLNQVDRFQACQQKLNRNILIRRNPGNSLFDSDHPFPLSFSSAKSLAPSHSTNLNKSTYSGINQTRRSISRSTHINDRTHHASWPVASQCLSCPKSPMRLIDRSTILQACPVESQLTVTAVPLVNQSICSSTMPCYEPVFQKMLCAGNMTHGVETCQVR